MKKHTLKFGGIFLNSPLYQLFGLVKRARFAIVGIELMEKLDRKKVFLIIVAHDASSIFIREMEHHNTELCDILKYGTKTELGLLLDRREVNAIGITDKNMAAKIKQTIQKGDVDE